MSKKTLTISISAYLKADQPNSRVVMTVSRSQPPWNNFEIEEHFTIGTNWEGSDFVNLGFKTPS